MSQPTVSKLVSALEAAALVQRQPDPADGRASLVHLSSRGRALVRRARARKIEYIESVTCDMDADTVRAVARALGADLRQHGSR